MKSVFEVRILMALVTSISKDFDIERVFGERWLGAFKEIRNVLEKLEFLGVFKGNKKDIGMIKSQCKNSKGSFQKLPISKNHLNLKNYGTQSKQNEHYVVWMTFTIFNLHFFLPDTINWHA